MEKARKIAPVILAGGSGVGLRPLTNNRSPKHFLRLFSKISLFQATVLRSSPFQAPVIVCHESYYPFVRRQLAEINVEPRAIILEPDHKGTATAVALAAFYLKNKGEYMLVLPSDQVLESDKEFETCVLNALDGIEDDIIIFGAVPSRSEKGHGYIFCVEGETPCHRVKKFLEKQELKKAHSLLEQYSCFWNTGIFLARPRTYLNELKNFEPEIHKFSERAFYAGNEDDNVFHLSIEDFSKIIPMAMEHIILKNGEKTYVYNLPVFWSDVGTWPQMIRLKMKSIFKKEKNIKNGSEIYRRVS